MLRRLMAAACRSGAGWDSRHLVAQPWRGEVPGSLDSSAGDPPFALSATASSALPVAFSIVSGTALTFCARLRDPFGKWSGPFFSKHGGHARLSCNLFATTLHGKMSIGFELDTDFKSKPLQVSFPMQRLDARASSRAIPCQAHGVDLIARFGA